MLILPTFIIKVATILSSIRLIRASTRIRIHSRMARWVPKLERLNIMPSKTKRLPRLKGWLHNLIWFWHFRVTKLMGLLWKSLLQKPMLQTIRVWLLFLVTSTWALVQRVRRSHFGKVQLVLLTKSIRPLIGLRNRTSLKSNTYRQPASIWRPIPLIRQWDITGRLLQPGSNIR